MSNNSHLLEMLRSYVSIVKVVCISYTIKEREIEINATFGGNLD